MYKMMLAIVNKGDAAKVMASARAAGARGGTIANARGTASNSILAALGLGDSKKEVLYSMIDTENEDGMRNSVVGNSNAKGILAFLPTLSEGCSMEYDWVLIQVICEKGYAEDIMAEARKAGATGGSVVHAHGTANADDAKFFGSPIVPEKEMLMIIERKDKAVAIVNAISKLEALNKRGKAVVFTLPVSSFSNLG